MKYKKSDNRQMPSISLLRWWYVTAALMGVVLMSSCEKNNQLPQTLIQEKANAYKDNNGWLSPDVVMAWNNALQQVYTYTPDKGSPPPIVSRQFAMYHVAMHDALNCIKPRFETYAYHMVDKDADPDAAVSQAVHDVVKAIGPQGDAFKPFADLFLATMAGIPDGDAKTRGVKLGMEVAKAVIAKRSPDMTLIGVNYAPKPVEGVDPGQYRYLPPFQYALTGFHLQQTWALACRRGIS